MRFIIQLVVSTLAVLICSYFLPGIKVDSFTTAIIVAVVLAFLNSVVKPIMILLTIPVTIFSFGIFLLFINAIIIIIADKLVDGFEVKSFTWAFIFSIALWLITQILDSIIKKSDEQEEG